MPGSPGIFFVLPLQRFVCSLALEVTYLCKKWEKWEDQENQKGMILLPFVRTVSLFILY